MNHAIILAGSFLVVSVIGIAKAQTKPAPSTSVGAETTAADAAFSAWDLDRNGSLSQQEFRKGWEQVRRTSQREANLRRQFMAVDSNKNGAIDPAEYSTLILVKNAGKAAPPLSSFDANKDGKLQLGEYLTLVQTLIPRDTSQVKAR